MDFEISITRGNMSQKLINAYKNLCQEVFDKADISVKKVSILPTKHVGSSHNQGIDGVRLRATEPGVIILIVQPLGNDTCREVRVIPSDDSNIEEVKRCIEQALKGGVSRSVSEVAAALSETSYGSAAIDLVIESMRIISIVVDRKLTRPVLRAPSFSGVLTDNELETFVELLTECGVVKLVPCKKKSKEACWEINQDLLQKLRDNLAVTEDLSTSEVVADFFGDEDDAVHASEIPCLPAETTPTDTADEPLPHEEPMNPFEQIASKIRESEKKIDAISDEIVTMEAQLIELRAQRKAAENATNQLRADLVELLRPYQELATPKP